MSDSVFGPVVPDTVIENGLLDQLKAWLPTYLRLVDRSTGRDTPMSVPKSWGIPQERFERWPERLTPHVGVVSAGIAGTPTHDGDGFYLAHYQIEITAVVSAKTPLAVERMAKEYIWAVEAAVLQQSPSDPTPIDQIDWLGHTPEDFSDKDRSMVGMTARFLVHAGGVLNRRAGPEGDPPNDPTVPPADFPQVTSHELTVTHPD